MKALVLKQYNTPPHLEEVEKPAPKKGQVLVKIEASGINPLDVKIVAGQAAHARVQLPAILGLDMAGTAEAVRWPNILRQMPTCSHSNHRTLRLKKRPLFR